MRRFLSLLAIAVVLVAASWYGYRRLSRCAGCGPLDAHRHAWQSHQLADYSFVYQEGGMACCYRVRVTVHDGHVVGSRVLHALANLSERPTVDDVFAAARHQMHSADRVSVTYDRQYGFPTLVSVDPNDRTMDDEYGFAIQQFRRLAPVNG
jgi:hypothetical protein